jgi:hypothetical protein
MFPRGNSSNCPKQEVLMGVTLTDLVHIQENVMRIIQNLENKVSLSMILRMP